MNLAMAVSVSLPKQNRPFRFFDLPREIRDDIYTRTMYFYDDYYILLAPKGRLPTYIGKPCEHRAGLYSRYQEFVSLFTVSRQFRDEALPIFWQKNTFWVQNSLGLESMPELPDRTYTALDIIGLPGEIYIARIRINILCNVFVKKPGSSEKNSEYDTDLGIMIKGLLERLPNLQMLEMSFSCSIKREDYPGWDTIEDMFTKVAASLLEFFYPMNCLEGCNEPKPLVPFRGDVAGRPIRAAREQEIRP